MSWEKNNNNNNKAYNHEILEQKGQGKDSVSCREKKIVTAVWGQPPKTLLETSTCCPSTLAIIICNYNK